MKNPSDPKEVKQLKPNVYNPTRLSEATKQITM